MGRVWVTEGAGQSLCPSINEMVFAMLFIVVVLYEVIRSFHYAETSALLLMIIAFVSLMDMASARIRRLTI